MALKSISGILERKTLGAFRLPRIFMPEIMCALCTMNLNVSMNAEVGISDMIEVNEYLRA